MVQDMRQSDSLSSIYSEELVQSGYPFCSSVESVHFGQKCPDFWSRQAGRRAALSQSTLVVSAEDGCLANEKSGRSEAYTSQPQHAMQTSEVFRILDARSCSGSCPKREISTKA